MTAGFIAALHALNINTINGEKKMSAQENLEILQKAFSTLNGEMDINVASEDVTLSYPGPPEIPYAGEWKGHKGLREFLELFYANVENQKMDLVDIMAVDDKAIVRGFTKATVKKTGKEFQSDWCLIWKMKDGKVIEMCEFQDTNAIASAYHSD